MEYGIASHVHTYSSTQMFVFFLLCLLFTTHDLESWANKQNCLNYKEKENSEFRPPIHFTPQYCLSFEC